MKPSHLLAGLLLLPLGALGQDSPELEAARKKLKLAPGLQATLWASEPLLQNPVAFAFDEQGRAYVAECHRRHTSTLDIHMRKEWLDDDLACRRHEDLVAYHEKRLGAKAAEWKVESERIRILTDKDGKGRATDAVTFSDGYRGLGEGIGAGILVRNGEVWYTCIPNLWHFKDGVRKALHTGFGVHLGASGHDMHGLRFGPDGKLYWSHGDRGFHVEAEGKSFSFPDGGGVFRANPDGSGLELVCVGLRNPQELAFDQYGNLFTGDNNISKAPDVGETCRWTYVVEGADYGWRIGYQFMPTGGAWCAEEQWKLEAAYQVPPVARLGHGPSGVTYHPGVAAIPDRYRDHFFMCDYPGGVYAFQMKPKGASFEMVDLTKLVWDVNAPDVEFGNDGALYAADWAGMWDKVEKGRIWRLADPSKEKAAAVAEVKTLIAEGMGKRTVDELAKLLAHADQRIRQNAQFELAARKDAATLSSLAKAGPQLTRIHAIWGLGQLGQGRPELLSDADPEIRAQAAKVIGESRTPADLSPLLKDPSPRVQFFAAMGLGKQGKKEAIPAVIDFLRANNNDDRMLQHAGIMALTWIGDVPSIVALGKDPSPPVRLAALVALRKLKRPEVAAFLKDHPLEAARAIYDTPIPEAMAALADLRTGPEPALLRAVNAMFRLGKAADLVAFAKGRAPLGARVEALRVLGEWTQPSGRDRLMGLWRPIPARDRKEVEDALKGSVTALLDEPEMAVEAVRLAGAPLAEIFDDRRLPAAARAGALRGMVESKDPRLGDAVARAVEDKDELVAREGVRHLRDAARLEKIASGDPRMTVRQAAVAALSDDGALTTLLDAGLPAALQLEWQEAAAKRPALKARAEKLEPSLVEGGDAAAGRRIFFERTDVQCVRCHKVAGEGGEVGPDLSKIAAQKDAAYLLESVLLPNKQIAEGWGQTALQLASDAVEVGRVEKESEREITLLLADGQRKAIAKADVKARKAALSAMPEDAAKQLSKRDLRDLTAYLSSLK